MPERRKYDPEFREGAVTIVRETGKSIAEVARELGVGAGTLGNWVKKDRLARGEQSDGTRVDPGYVRRLERENAELRMEGRRSERRGATMSSKSGAAREACWQTGGPGSGGFVIIGVRIGYVTGVVSWWRGVW